MPLARLRGTVEDKGEGWAIVATGGIGLLVAVPATTADGLRVGDPASLFTHLHVREDALSLFGFATADDLALFELLIGVSGVGPRAALGLLSALDYGELSTAIASGRADALRRVPGIGQKTAERIVLDLRDKVTPPSDGGGVRREEAGVDREVVDALVALGYSNAEAQAAAERLTPDGEMPLEERVRAALRLFT
jgi:Holliday junction DNA helicase RuvA